MGYFYFALCAIFLFCRDISAAKLMEAVPLTYEVHGDIDTSVYVDTILECSRYCHQRKTCDYLVYNDTTGLCVTIKHSENLTQRHGNELFFRKEKVCSFPEYEYIWNLDICIEFYTKSLSWTASQNRCENNDGGLLVVDSFRKQSFIHPRLRRASVVTGISKFWIGGNDMAEEGHFKWINGRNFTYTNWKEGDPNGFNVANCIRSNLKFKWFDRNCQDKLASICENNAFL